MLIQFLTYLILFVVPLIVIPGINLRFEPPKVLITELLIEVLAVCLIWSGKFSLRIPKIFTTLIGGLFLLSLGHLIFSPTEKNLFGNIFRLQGTILFWHLLLFAVITQNYCFRLKEKYIYTTSFIAICAGMLIYGTNSAGRWVGSLGEPNALAAVVVFIFPVMFLSFKSIWIRIFGVIATLGVINFSQSRSALIALGLELLFILLVKIFKGRVFLASILTFILFFISLSLPILDREYFLRTNTDPFNFRYEDRAEIWRVGLNAGFGSPIFGSGLESMQEKLHQTAQELNVNSQYQVIDSSHNILLDYFLWGGFVGIILFSLLCFFAIKNMIKKKMILELTVFIGLLIVLSFNPTTVSVLAGFWWIIGRSFEAKERVEL